MTAGKKVGEIGGSVVRACVIGGLVTMEQRIDGGGFLVSSDWGTLFGYTISEARGLAALLLEAVTEIERVQGAAT